MRYAALKWIGLKLVQVVAGLAMLWVTFAAMLAIGDGDMWILWKSLAWLWMLGLAIGILAGIDELFDRGAR